MDTGDVHTRAVLSGSRRRGLLWTLAGIVALVWLSAAPAGFWSGAVVVTVGVAVLILPVALMRVDVRAGQDGIRATWGPLVRLRFAASEIAAVRPVDERGGFCDGLGLRHLGDRTWGLLVGGSAVQVDLRSGRSWVLSTPLPREVAAAVTV